KRAEQRLRDQNSIRREIASAKPSPKPLESPNAPKSHDRVQLPDSRVPDADCAESLGDLLPPSPPAEKDHAFPPCELSRSNSATSSSACPRVSMMFFIMGTPVTLRQARSCLIFAIADKRLRSGTPSA